jgi:hypothetical protein
MRFVPWPAKFPQELSAAKRVHERAQRLAVQTTVRLAIGAAGALSGMAEKSVAPADEAFDGSMRVAIPAKDEVQRLPACRPAEERSFEKVG